MSRLSREIRLHRRGGIPRKVGLSMRRRSLAIGLVLATGRFLMLVGVLGMVAWSYSIWGSELSPLRHLLVPSLVMVAVSIVIRLALLKTVRWMGRAMRLERRRKLIREAVRSKSQITRKL